MPSCLKADQTQFSHSLTCQASQIFAHLCDYAFIFEIVLFYYDKEDDFVFALEQWF